MFDEWFYKNYHKHREAIDKFWKERPKGMKLCPNCQNIFNTPGYPVEGSWTCNPACNATHNFRHSNEIAQDSISRLYLIDIERMNEQGCFDYSTRRKLYEEKEDESE